MSRLIMSQEQIEKEAQILADYKNKKMKDLEKFIATMEKAFDREVEALFNRLEANIKTKAQHVFSTQEQKKVMKDLGLIETKNGKTKKTAKKRKKKTLPDFKGELIKALQKELEAGLEEPVIEKEFDIDSISVSDVLIKEAPKKKRGRPPGSKNKPKSNISVVNQPIRFGDWDDLL